ncbi:response regulator, partial [candidate division KSB3 bacterium]|nr:response regulator [candidate division KSB3 bacterium]MBD3326410.1 response regulator [candidate division KSB3 bacterium]
PLIYDHELYGILELASAEPFDTAKQKFLDETNRVIATAIFSTKQREQVQNLLEISRQAQAEAERAAQEAEQAKQDAQQKAEDVQQANIQLEEQQQKLQQQSEELQQINAHLEEQQHRLQQQSEELRQQNDSLNRAKEELDKRAKDLELASKYKSEFLANMSHELRTPLNSIILLSKMLSRNDKQNLDEKDIKQVNVIHQAGEELLRLINDILDLSKIEAGKVTLNPSQFSTASLVKNFHDLFHSLAEEKGLDFIVQDELNTTMVSDKDKLSQVIRNLLSNAFKFTRQGSITLHLQASPTQKDHVQISVTDTGIGIPKDKQQLVFEAFQQADGSTSREFGGTGLGLSIAREYVKLLQGTIVLESEEGQGTTFTLTLPLVLPDIDMPAASPEEASDQEQPLSMPSSPAPQSLSAIDPSEIVDDRDHIIPQDKVILIIEDNADLAHTTMEVTRDMGFKVLVALDGRTGLTLAEQFRPTGILLDLVLPDINGMEVLRELKSTRELRHIPVHIVSSKERDNTFRHAGAIGYYQKPLNDIDIQHAIENLVAVSEKYPKHLLIVEDNDTQREALRDFISESDEIQIVGVPSQTQAIEEIEKEIYDAAIIDLELKDGSGYDICKYIKERNIPLPVIIYTGRELTEAEERELRKYTDSIIIKTARSYERLSDEVSLFLHKMSQDAETQSASPHSLPHPLESQGDLSGKKVLIVDDDMKNVFVLASALENNGATVIDAPNGKAALERLRQEHDIALVLMDVMMPVMDGYTAIREIRKDDQLKHLPIIALTAKALKGDRQKCIQAGANDYISKPVDYDGLIRLVKAWIEKD